MAIVTQTINVDLRPHYNRRNQSMVYCSQYDNDLRNIVLNIANEGEPVDVSTYTIYIEGTKPDKHGFSYELTSIGGSVSNNVITVPLQTQMTAVAGLTNAEVVLYSNDERIGSANFILNVEKAGLAEDVDISETDIPAYVDGAQQAAAEATQAKDDAVSAKDTAVSAAETAQTVLDSIPEDYSELSDSVLDLKNALVNNASPLEQGKLSGSFATVETGWMSSATTVTHPELVQLKKGTKLTVSIPSGLKLGIMSFEYANGTYTRKQNEYLNSDYVIPYENRYWTFYAEKDGGGSLTPAECVGLGVYSYKIIDRYEADLYICGYDAPIEVYSFVKGAEARGCGYCIEDSSELETGVNTFIDRYISQRKTIHFYGTIYTSVGIHKHPLHNLEGYNCILKMGDSLGANYVCCIRPTTGGIAYDSGILDTQVVSHNDTFIKGFTLDGNAANNMSGGAYSFNALYGGVIVSEIYNETTSPYRGTQMLSDILLEDIKTENTMRGIIVGIGWKCRNLTLGDAVTDHALYLAGADGAEVDGVYITGSHTNGAIAVSGASWDSERRVKGVSLANIRCDECKNYILQIRGLFSGNTVNDAPCENVHINGLYIRNIKNIASFPAILIGTDSASISADANNRDDYPMNIVIENMFVDAYLGNSFFMIANASTVIKDSLIRLHGINATRPIFRMESNANVNKFCKMQNVTIDFVSYSQKKSKDYIWDKQVSTSIIGTGYRYVGDVTNITITSASGWGYQVIGYNSETKTEVYASPYKTGTNTYQPRSKGYDYILIKAYKCNSSGTPTGDTITVGTDDIASNYTVTFDYGFTSAPSAYTLCWLLNESANFVNVNGLVFEDVAVYGVVSSYLLGVSSETANVISLTDFALERVVASGISSAIKPSAQSHITVANNYLTY